MKKLFLLSAAALMVLASCTKDEVAQTPDQKITFSSPVVGAVTKAPVYGEMPVQYDKGEQFVVYGLHTKGNYATWGAGLIYMNGVTCSYQSEYNGWAPASLYYWPKNEDSYLTFAAYSPAQVLTDVTANNIAYGADGLTINYFSPNADASKQYDLMYSERTYNQKGPHGSEYDPTTSAEHTEYYHGVDLKFHHTLSAINFKVASGDYTNGSIDDLKTGTSIKLNSIVVNDVVAVGNFKENVTDGTEYSSNPAWNIDLGNESRIADYSVATANAADLNMDLTKETAKAGNSLILIPQNFDRESDKISVTIKYTITNPDGKTWPQEYTMNLSDFIYQGNGFDNSKQPNGWEMGKKYTYTITIGLTQIHFAPEVTGWDDVTATETI